MALHSELIAMNQFGDESENSQPFYAVHLPEDGQTIAIGFHVRRVFQN